MIMKSIVGSCLILTALTISVRSTSTAHELPSNFKTCNQSDPKWLDCVANAARDTIVSLDGGLKSFRILPIEPLAVDSIKLGESKGIVNLKQDYRNIKIHGLTKGLEITNYQIDWNKCLLTSDSYNPQVDFVADYKIRGNILLLPISGSGKSNITMYDLKSQNEIYCQIYEKDGEKYLKITKYVIKFHPARVNMVFENLFDGNNFLGEQMNKFINENSDLLFQELQGPYEESFGAVFANIANKIFSRVPMDKIFPKT